ncbi:hypothetical protein GCM10009682_37740 [Luedemannella flava]|uniref:Antitoxin n=1 Tax=Luedemannella flava TaxID=349316 RepID=A0ABN2M8H2_9ACTN
MGIRESMGDLADRARNALKDHGDEVVDEAGDKLDEKTAGRYEGQIDKGRSAAKEMIDKHL